MSIRETLQFKRWWAWTPLQQEQILEQPLQAQCHWGM